MCPQGVCWKMLDWIYLTTNHTGCGILWALIALKSISWESFPIHTGWFDMTCCVTQQFLTLLILLCLKWEKIPAAMFHHLVKNLPRNLEVNPNPNLNNNKRKTNLSGFERKYSVSTWYGPHTFGCCLCWYEEGTKYWTMRYPSSWCDSNNLSLHTFLFHEYVEGKLGHSSFCNN